MFFLEWFLNSHFWPFSGGEKFLKKVKQQKKVDRDYLVSRISLGNDKREFLIFSDFLVKFLIEQRRRVFHWWLIAL